MKKAVKELLVTESIQVIIPPIVTLARIQEKQMVVIYQISLVKAASASRSDQST